MYYVCVFDFACVMNLLLDKLVSYTVWVYKRAYVHVAKIYINEFACL